jgi:magnesium chelatase accessory protein
MSPPARVPADWPLRAASRAVAAGGLDWHVQVAGQGPALLLLHGTGGATHSWAELVPRLAERATVVVPDLPGHGFTTGAAVDGLSLPRVTAALHALWGALGLPPPVLVAGHSAGAALALRWALDEAAAGRAAPAVLGFAPSLVAPPAAYTRYLAPLIHPLATAGPVARLLARSAPSMGLIDGLLRSTGSALGEAQRARYRRLFTDPAHVQGAIGFMAAADLPALLADCARAAPPRTAFVLGAGDRWIPERWIRPVVARHLPGADVQAWPGGHLVHEEQPAWAAARVLALLDEAA